MNYKTLTFKGSPEQWFNQVINARDHVLLSPDTSSRDSTPHLPPKNAPIRQLGLYTSATSGRAKCIWNSYNNIQKNAQITAREFGISRDDRLLIMAKPWHIAGMSWVLMAESADANYKFITTRSGESEIWQNAIRDYGPDYLLTVPTVVRSLFKDENWQVPTVVLGGSPMQENDYAALAYHADHLIQAYGQTEAGGLISCHFMNLNRRSSLSNYLSCYGDLPNEMEVHCKGKQGSAEPIMLHSPTAVHNGFYNTGDEGYISADDQLYLTGRA